MIRSVAGKRDIRWAAGLFEGEGWASLDTHRRPYGQGAYIYATAGLATTDEDVLQEFKRIMGGRIFGPYTNKNGVKKIWAWRVRNEEAKAALTRLLPYMGRRRAIQIQKVFDATK